jgi:hypothetical protein
MNDKLIQELAEISGMAQTIFNSSEEDHPFEHISEMIFCRIDEIIESLSEKAVNESQNVCKHEFDGKFYFINGEEAPQGDVPRFFIVKCRKCGEFYR